MATSEPGPIRSARMLRADLRRAREVAGLTQQEVAEQMEWSLSKVARIENGDVGISDNDLRPLARLLGLGETASREMLRRNELSRARGWWHDYRAIMSPALTDLVGLEAETEQLREYALVFVPVVLQTPAYASALTAGAANADSEPGRLALQQHRQKSLLDRADPAELLVLLDESVLHRSVGGPGTMAAQVRRLAELARRPHVHIRVVPFEHDSRCPHGFVLVGREFAYAELMSREELSDRVQLFEDHFDRLWQGALDADRTGQLLHRVAAAYESGRRPRPWLWD